MKNTNRASFLVFVSIFFSFFANSQSPIPYLSIKGTTKQLIVDGKPFIILGGELGNSTATTLENMQSVWPKLKTMHLNTVLVPVYWELIEAEEGKFDFSLYQNLIIEARKNDLKIVFLWFGSWKNSMSSHPLLAGSSAGRLRTENKQSVCNTASANSAAFCASK